MPAYLTHAMVLIRMSQWLELLRTRIDDRRATLQLAGRPLPDLDERLYHLAGRTLTYLREDPTVAADVALPTTRITNGVGDRISKFAFVGSLGPDLPAAAYPLAINHDWAWHTLHKGAPRRAWVDSKSTMFVRKLLELVEKDEREGRLPAAQRRRTVSYAIGHLSHIAADVVLHPAVHALTWNDARGALDPLAEQSFEVAMDARTAHGFFQREDLYDDAQSWEDYYLDKGDFKEPLTLLMNHLSGAFKETYGQITPNAPVCGLDNPSKCLSPKFDAEFLMDGYRNTTNWALDEGYDHNPVTLDIVWSLTILAGAMMSAFSLAGATESFSTITNTVFGANQEAVDALSAKASQEWQDNGTESIDLWRDVIDTSHSWSGYVALPYEWLFGGSFVLKLLTFWQVPDGMFGHGTASFGDQPGIRQFTTIAFPVKDIGSFVLGEIVPQFTEQGWWKWLWFVVDGVKDVLEHAYLTSESRADNVEADRLAHTTYVPKKILAASHFLANGIMLLWKSERQAVGGGRARGVEPEDFVLPLIFANLTAAIFVWSGLWRDYFLLKTAGAHWPSANTSAVNDFLPVETVGARRRITATDARKFKVRLFPDDPTVIKSEGGAAYFPEGDVLASDVEHHAASDTNARRAALSEFTEDEYTLPDLLEHAVRFAGLLGMAAVAYNDAAAPVREHLTGIFKDWNLDFASVAQWKELLAPVVAAEMGILSAASVYTNDLDSHAAVPSEQAIARIQKALGVIDLAGSIDADFARTGDAIAGLDRSTARAVRLKRPGAILLANLDIESLPAIPAAPAPLPSRAGLLDAKVDDKVSNAGNDKDELTAISIRRPGAAGAPHDLLLRLHADDAARLRVFEVGAGTPDTWPAVLGATAAGVKTEYVVPPGDANTEVEYRIEALSLAGDPGLRPASGPGPLVPAPFSPGALASGAPVVAERRPTEIWLEVLHKEGGAIVPGIRDTAVFTVAPFLLLPNTQPVERIWIVYLPDGLRRVKITALPGGAVLRNAADTGNHPTVADLHDILKSDVVLAGRLNVSFHSAATGTLDEFDGHKPVPEGDSDNAKLLYIIDGRGNADKEDTVVASGGFHFRSQVTNIDQWVQDAFELGYAWAPQASGHMHVALNTPRTALANGLGKFLDRELPAENLGLFAPFPISTDSVDFGGNLECSPPVAADTGLLPDGPAGPEVPAQGPATHGKIILGEGAPHLFDIAESFAAALSAGSATAALVAEFKAHNCFLDAAVSVRTLVPDRKWRITTGSAGMYELRRVPGHVAVHFYRGVMDDYRAFLAQQRVQPIVSIDTSWLDVGHVDEVAVIVPDADPARRFRLVVANTQLAVDILKEAVALNTPSPAAHPLTRMFRRKRWRPPGSTSTPPDMAEGVNAAQTAKKALDRGKAFNERIQTERLGPIRDRLRTALGVAPADVVELPVLFDSLPVALISHLGAHHWKPSVVSPPAVEKFTTMRTAAYTPNLVNLQVVNNHLIVPRPFGPRMKPADVLTVLTNAGVAGATIADLAPLVEHDSWERRGTTIAALATSFGVPAAAIKSHPANTGKFTAADTVQKNWERIHIPEPLVDLFEACTVVRLKPTGALVHFIDTWDWYHRLDGEIHCGTNVQRTPYENDPAFPAWWDADTVKG